MCYKKRRKNLVIRDLFDETPDVLEYGLRIHVAIKIKSTWSVKIFFRGGGRWSKVILQNTAWPDGPVKNFKPVQSKSENA